MISSALRIRIATQAKFFWPARLDCSRRAVDLLRGAVSAVATYSGIGLIWRLPTAVVLASGLIILNRYALVIEVLCGFCTGSRHMRLGRDTRLVGKILVGSHPVERHVRADVAVEGLKLGQGRASPRDGEFAYTSNSPRQRRPTNSCAGGCRSHLRCVSREVRDMQGLVYQRWHVLP